jgi:hypothetical protein
VEPIPPAKHRGRFRVTVSPEFAGGVDTAIRREELHDERSDRPSLDAHQEVRLTTSGQP